MGLVWVYGLTWGKVKRKVQVRATEALKTFETCFLLLFSMIMLG